MAVEEEPPISPLPDEDTASQEGGAKFRFIRRKPSGRKRSVYSADGGPSPGKPAKAKPRKYSVVSALKGLAKKIKRKRQTKSTKRAARGRSVERASVKRVTTKRVRKTSLMSKIKSKLTRTKAQKKAGPPSKRLIAKTKKTRDVATIDKVRSAKLEAGKKKIAAIRSRARKQFDAKVQTTKRQRLAKVVSSVLGAKSKITKQLSAIRGKANEKLSGAKQRIASAFGVGSSKRHAEVTNQNRLSTTTAANANRDLGNAAGSNTTNKPVLDRVSNARGAEAANMVNHSTKRTEALIKRDNADGAARDAAKNAGNAKRNHEAADTNRGNKAKERDGPQKQLDSAKGASDTAKRNAGAASNEAGRLNGKIGEDTGKRNRRMEDATTADTNRGIAGENRKKNAGLEADASGRLTKAQGGKQKAMTDHQKSLDAAKANTDGAVSGNKSTLGEQGKQKGLREGELRSAAGNRKTAEDAATANTGALGLKKPARDSAAKSMNGAKGKFDAATGKVNGAKGRKQALEGAAPGMKSARDGAKQIADNARPTRNPADVGKQARRGQITATDLPNAKAKHTAAKGKRGEVDGDLTKAKEGRGKKQEAADAEAKRIKAAEDIEAVKKRAREGEATSVEVGKANSGQVNTTKQKRKPALDNALINADRTKNMIDARTLTRRAGIEGPEVTSQVGIRNSAQQAIATQKGGVAAKTHAKGVDGLGKSQGVAQGADTARKGAAAGNAEAGPAAARVRGRVDAETGNRQRHNEGRGRARQARDGAAEGGRAAGQMAGGAARGRDAAAGNLVQKGKDRAAAKGRVDEAAAAARKIRNDAQASADQGSATVKNLNDAIGLSKTRGGDAAAAKRGREGAAAARNKHDADATAAGGRKITAEKGLAQAKAEHAANQGRLQKNAGAEVTLNGSKLQDAGAARLKQAGEVEAAGRTRKGLEDAATTNAGQLDSARGKRTQADISSRNAETTYTGKKKGVDNSKARLQGLEEGAPGLRAKRDSAATAADGARPMRDPADTTRSGRARQIRETDLPAAKARAGKKKGDRDAAKGALDDAALIRRNKGGEREGLEGDIAARQRRGDELQQKRGGAASDLDAAGRARGRVGDTLEGRQKGLQGPLKNKDNLDAVLDTKRRTAGVDQPPPPLKKSRGEAADDMTAGSKRGAEAEGNLRRSGERGAEADTIRRATGDELETNKKRVEDVREGVEGAAAAKKGHSDGREGASKAMKDADADGGAAATKRATAETGAADADGGRTKAKQDRDQAADAADRAKMDADAQRKNAADAKADADRSLRTMGDDVQARGKRQDEATDADTARKRASDDADAHAKGEEAAGGRRRDAEDGLAGAKKEHDARIKEIEADAGAAVGGRKRDLDSAAESNTRRKGEADDATERRLRAEDEFASTETARLKKQAEAEAAQRKMNDADADRIAAAKQRGDLEDSLTGKKVKGETLEGELGQRRTQLDESTPRRDADADAKGGRKKQIDGEDLPGAKKKKEDLDAQKKKGVDDLDESIRKRDDADEQRKKAKKDADDAEEEAAAKRKKKEAEEAELERKKKNRDDNDADADGHKKKHSRFTFLSDVIQNVMQQIRMRERREQALAGDEQAMNNLLDLGGTPPEPPKVKGEPGATGPSGPGAGEIPQGIPMPPPGASDDYTKGYIEGVKVGQVEGAVAGEEAGSGAAPTVEELERKLKELDDHLAKETAKVEAEAKQVALDEFCRTLKVKSAVEGVPFRLEDNPECKDLSGAEAEPSANYGYGEVAFDASGPGQPLTEADVGQTGGGWYRSFEDLSFGEIPEDLVEQEGGAVEPSAEYDRGYKDGYDIAYQAAYDYAYMMKKKAPPPAVSVPSGPRVPPAYGVGFAPSGPSVPSGPEMIPPLIASGPEVAPPIMQKCVCVPVQAQAQAQPVYGAPSSYPVVEGPTQPSGPFQSPVQLVPAPVLPNTPIQSGGSASLVQRAQRARHRRAHTFTRHSGLLNKIKEKTIFVEG